MKEFIVGTFLGLLISGAVAYSSSLRASQTLDLDEEYRDGGKKVCVYSDGRNTAVVYRDGAGSCNSKYLKH